MAKQMKTLTLNDTLYEITDEFAREDISRIDSVVEDVIQLVEQHTEKLNQVVNNPEVGEVEQILAIETVDENGKPLTYMAIDKPSKTAYEYALEGGYKGSEADFRIKLAQENPTMEEFNELKNNLIASDDIEFRFGVNEDGKYGYIITGEDGADTVIPFKNSSFTVIRLEAEKTNTGSTSNCVFDVRNYNTLTIESVTNKYSSSTTASGFYVKKTSSTSVIGDSIFSKNSLSYGDTQLNEVIDISECLYIAITSSVEKIYLNNMTFN